jgi:hypothetical protein
MCLVIDEQDGSPHAKRRLKKGLKKKARKGTLGFTVDTIWAFRLFCARMMRGNYSDWRGHEFRSKWAYEIETKPFVYKKWDGYDDKLIVLAEQGIGDEIINASVFDQLTIDCPNATVEVDSRLLPIMRRSYPRLNFISRWVDDKYRTPQNPRNYKPGTYRSYIPSASLLKYYRTGVCPPGTSFLKPHEGMKEYWLDYLKQFPKPWIGISWAGGRSDQDPERLRRWEKGTYFSIQYKLERDPLDEQRKIATNDHSVEWAISPPGLDHEYIDSMFSFVSALDWVVTTQNYMVHVAGSVGKECHAVRPPPIFGDEDDADNNRLKWYYGTGGRMPWYNSVWYYRNDNDFKNGLRRYDESSNRWTRA